MILLDNGNLLVDLHPIAKNIIKTIQDDASINLSDTEAYATNYLVTNLVEQGLWDKIKALYGFIGGTAATHRWNWKTMLDTDAGFRLSFLGGGWVHTSNGVQGNGTTSYANTFFNPRSELPTAENHLSIYSNSLLNNTSQMIDLGCYSGPKGCFLAIRRQSTPAPGSQYTVESDSSVLNSPSLSITDRGYMTIGSSKSGSAFILRNGNITVTQAVVATSPYYPNLNMYIGAITQGSTPSYYTNRNYNTITIGEGLTLQESITLSSIITTYNRILNRA